MLTKEFLSAIHSAVFAPYFHEEIRSQFHADVERGSFTKEQQEYEQASTQLRTVLTPEKQKALLVVCLCRFVLKVLLLQELSLKTSLILLIELRFLIARKLQLQLSQILIRFTKSVMIKQQLQWFL